MVTSFWRSRLTHRSFWLCAIRGWGRQTDRNALIDYGNIHETGAAGRGHHQIRAIYSAKGVAADIARTKIPETLGSREQDGELVT
jgi:hypothetical protein